MKRRSEIIQPDVIRELVQLRHDKFVDLVDVLFSAIGEADSKTRKLIFRKVLVNFLESYSSISGLTVKRKSQDIMHYFKTSDEVQVRLGYNLSASIDDMLEFFFDSQNQVRKIEDFMKPVVSKLICMYIAFALSDKEGITMCKNLVKELTNWKNDIPNNVILLYLGNGEKSPNRLDEIVKTYQF
jgi:hypothetical protein